jgi:RND family efflux transporter MFP subunit
MAFDEPQPGFFSRYRWPVIAALAIALVAFVVFRNSRPTPVGVIEARQGPAERVLAISGRTRPQVTVNIVPKSPGQIVRLTKEEGDSVKAGEVIAQLDSEAPRAAVDEVLSKITLQQRAVAEAERNFRRLEQLRAQGLATVKEFDSAKFELDQAKVSLEGLAATRREVASRLSDNTIVSPVSGVVLSRPIDPGQVVSAATVIYEIAPLSDVEVEADVDERYLPEIRDGLKADILVTGQPKPISATLYYVSPKVDPRTGGARVKLKLDQQIEGLRSGLTADVNIIVERRESAVTVSRSAILGRDGEARVLLVKDGRVVPQPVSFMEWPSERVIVLAGLQPGQQVLASPRPDLIGERVVPTTDISSIPAGERPRGSEARKSL